MDMVGFMFSKISVSYLFPNRMEIIPYLVVALIAMKTPQLVKESRWLKAEYTFVWDSVTNVMHQNNTFNALERVRVVDSIHFIKLERLGYARAKSDTTKRHGLIKLFRKKDRRPRDTL